jgi:hypothetical protein
VADISDTLELKLEAVRAYQTQFPPGKQSIFQWLESLNRHWGQTAGFAAGEVFLLHRSIGTGDLMTIANPALVRFAKKP